MFKARSTLAQVGDKLISLEGATPSRIIDLRAAEQAGTLKCPVCGISCQLTVEEPSPRLDHPDTHDPEDSWRHEARILLSSHMTKLFPSATVERNVLIENEWADVVIVKPDGGMLALFLISTNLRPGNLRARTESLERVGIKPLYVLDHRRLGIRKAKSNLAACDIRITEIELLRGLMPLLYLDAEKVQIKHVLIPRRLSVLIEDPATHSFGRIHVAFRNFRLSALRVIYGAWKLPPTLNWPLPDPPPLPKRLEARVHRKRS